jgi:hypothetical protein
MCDLKSKSLRQTVYHVLINEHRNTRCWRPLCSGDAFRDRKDSVSLVPDRGISTVLPGAQEAHLLLS